MTKYLVLIGDGMSDRPLKALKGKTPLEVAKTPNLDFLAQNGIVGWTNNTPKPLPPGSDVAAMSIFGYDPKKYYSGRGPLEAASLGVKLKKDEIAFRCNLVSVKEGKMDSFTSHHIKTAESRKIMKMLDKKLGTKDIRFVPGLSYRHLLILKSEARVATTPPHDITGKPIRKYLPKSDLLLQLMNQSEVLLHEMKTKATMIWPWGQGKAPNMPSFKKKYGKRAAVITAVDLLKGFGKTLGMTVINVPGATGYLDTNYVGKAQYALRALKTHDLVFVHVEAPDEAGHEGSIPKKIKAIEDFDRKVVGTILKAHRPIGLKVLVLPDHPTPISLMTHSRDDVPFVIWGGGPVEAREGVKGYNEKEVKKSKLKIKNGYQLIKQLLA
ncbi:MAG: cofactor-independent phosphoglycerate mutase [bacterium]